MYNLKIRKINNTNHTNDGSFLQTPFWCQFKSNHGWNYQRFEIVVNLPDLNSERECDDNHQKPVDSNTEKTMECSVLVRNFAHGLFSMAYIPLYPELLYKCTPEEVINNALDSDDAVSVISETVITPETQAIEYANFLADLSKALKTYLPKNCICIRFDPAVEFSDPDLRDDFNYGIKIISFADRLKLKKNKVDIQPPDSTQISLIETEDEILNRMKSKWRYNIRLAEKKDVQIEKISGNSEDLSSKLDIFYSLYKTTSERDGIAIHPKSYYEDLLKLSSQKLAAGEDVPQINMYLAKHEDDYLGSIITLFSKTESIYLYGCSSNEKRNLMPNFLLQWTAMKDAKAYGSLYYDMYGMPPTDDENHPMHGLYLFKTGFGGKNIHRTGTWDIQLKQVYKLCTLAESARAFWHKVILKKIRGR